MPDLELSERCMRSLCGLPFLVNIKEAIEGM